MARLYLFVFYILLLSEAASSQGLIKPELRLTDTVETKNLKTVSGEPITDFKTSGNLLVPEFKIDLIKFPKFNFNKGLLNFREDYSYSVLNLSGELNLNQPFGSFPLFRSSAIFNQAAYRLSDKFLVGGNSFGAQSIFSAPSPNSGATRFDTRGAMMFLQYKVSKNFKIETSVSVTNGQPYP